LKFLVSENLISLLLKLGVNFERLVRVARKEQVLEFSKASVRDCVFAELPMLSFGWWIFEDWFLVQ
jgi:hypothetical protein